jgi:hypothetical protein
MNHQHLEVGQDVVFVGPDKHTHKGKITKVYSENEAHIEWANGSAIASHSDKPEPNTFHFGEASTKGEEKK